MMQNDIWKKGVVVAVLMAVCMLHRETDADNTNPRKRIRPNTIDIYPVVMRRIDVIEVQRNVVRIDRIDRECIRVRMMLTFPHKEMKIERWRDIVKTMVQESIREKQHINIYIELNTIASPLAGLKNEYIRQLGTMIHTVAEHTAECIRQNAPHTEEHTASLLVGIHMLRLCGQLTEISIETMLYSIFGQQRVRISRVIHNITNREEIEECKEYHITVPASAGTMEVR